MFIEQFFVVKSEKGKSRLAMSGSYDEAYKIYLPITLFCAVFQWTSQPMEN